MEDFTRILMIVWRIFVRRKWSALALAWFVGLIGWVGVATLPDRYESQAQIYVDTSTLLGPLLKGLAVQGDINQQLRVMQRTLFTRPNLEKVIRDNDLDLLVHTPDEMEKLMQGVEKQAQIKSAGPNLFLVSFQDKDPKLARDVTQSFLDIFVSTNVGQSRVGMETARSFIEGQIEKYESQLRDAEQQLADFKVKNADFLSEGKFFTRYEAVRREHREAKQAISDSRIQKRQLEAQLKSTPRFLSVDAAPGVIVQREPQKSNVELLVEELESNLAQLKASFTDQHPDVISTQQSLDSARERLAKERENAKTETKGPEKSSSQIPNAVYEQLQVRLFEVGNDLARDEENFNRIDAELSILEEQKSSAPAIEAELSGLNRDYGVIKSQYEELLKRRESVNLSAARETSTDAVQFRVIEPPEVPILPSAPNRKIMSIAVLVVALGIGGGMPVLMGIASGYVYSSRNLEEVYNLPVLGSVGYVNSAIDTAGKLASRAFFALCLILLLACGAGVFLLQPSPDMIQGFVNQYDFQQYIDGGPQLFFEKVKTKLEGLL